MLRAASSDTELESSEDARRFARSDAGLILDLAGDAVITIDEAGVVRSWNAAAEKLLGYRATEIVGRAFATLLPSGRAGSGILAELRSALGQRGVEAEYQTSAGRRLTLSTTCSELLGADGSVLGHCCLIRDPSIQRAVVHQLYGSEKLAALRTMAVGLAHELGNPLAGVLSLLQLAERQTREDGTRARLIQARAELSRIGKMIRELTDFTRSDGTRSVIHVNDVLQEALVLARYAHEGAPVSARLEADPAVRPLTGSRSQLLQVCLHVLMNAYDAMSETGGTLQVGSQQGGDAIALWFEDSGRGIEPDLLPRIFEPFFTTKPEGSGTGLGLFVCDRIVTQELGGRIEVESTPGVGTRLRLRLPLRDRPPAGAGRGAGARGVTG